MKAEGRTSFYKLLCNHNFSTQIRLPPEFVEKHGKKLSEKAKVVAAESGDSYYVKIERIGEHHFLTDGWLRFAHDAHLKFWEFLLFKFVGKSTFEVFVYGIDGCMRELSPEGDDLVRTTSFKTKEESESESGTSGSGDEQIFWTTFVKKLTPDHTFELEIPRELAVANGIIRNNKLKLKDEKGKKWAVYVTKKKCGKIVMTVGWNEFLTATRIKIGSRISLEFVSKNIIKVKVVEKGSDDGDLFSCVKRRGRPPKLED